MFAYEKIFTRYRKHIKIDLPEYNSNGNLSSCVNAMDALAFWQPISKFAAEHLLKPASSHPQHSICFSPSFWYEEGLKINSPRGMWKQKEVELDMQAW